ncbi:MAG: hypothetical protein DWI21_16100 [Planctomycetota bacterium]|nr:MAG: hypothetical protein DWI21_16100 [Planctomycetota bacterium]GDY10401.1 hypothetical protein LBMAG52_38890 [Planctomycetia bacterium]
MPFVSNLGAVGSGDVVLKPRVAGLWDGCCCPAWLWFVESSGLPGSTLLWFEAGMGPRALPIFPAGTAGAALLRLSEGAVAPFGAIFGAAKDDATDAGVGNAG